MLSPRTSNNMRDKLHERSLRIIMNDYSRDFTELSEINNICNHHRNIQKMLIEVLKMKNQLAPSIMKLILNKIFNTHNLRNLQEVVTERKGTVWYGLETLSYWHAQLWSLLPETFSSSSQNLKEPLRNEFAVTVSM